MLIHRWAKKCVFEGGPTNNLWVVTGYASKRLILFEVSKLKYNEETLKILRNILLQFVRLKIQCNELYADAEWLLYTLAFKFTFTNIRQAFDFKHFKRLLICTVKYITFVIKWK